MVAWDWGHGRRLTTKRQEETLQGNGAILCLDEMEIHQIVHIELSNLILCKLHLNRAGKCHFFTIEQHNLRMSVKMFLLQGDRNIRSAKVSQ